MLLGGHGEVEQAGDPLGGGVHAGGVHIAPVVAEPTLGHPQGQHRLDHHGACGRGAQDRPSGASRIPLVQQGLDRRDRVGVVDPVGK